MHLGKTKGHTRRWKRIGVSRTCLVEAGVVDAHPKLRVGLWDDDRVGQLLALLKYPFYLVFNFDNGMNLISKSLTILTSGQLLVVFTFAHIFWRYFIFAGFLTNFGA